MPRRRNRFLIGAAFALGMGVITATSWAIWLGWDDEYNADGTGPYQPWQVIGLLVCLLGVAVVAGLCGRRWLACLVVPISLALAVAFDWSRDVTAGDASLWPVGAALIAIGAFVGVFTVASLTEGVQTFVNQRRETTPGR
jgi:hypothetical protein